MILAVTAAVTLLGSDAHPLQPQLDRFLAQQAEVTNVAPTGLTRDDYLRAVAGMVRTLQPFVKADGNLPDPVDGRTQFAPACYAHCVATLVASGVDRDPAMLESGCRAMDYSVNALAAGLTAFPDRHADFYPHPVMLAFEHFASVVPTSRVAVWRAQLGRIDPARTYAAYGKADNNWTLVHAAGEFLRARQGLTDLAYVSRALMLQRPHITALGLYRENGAPFAYDAFSRYFLTGMLQRGLDDDFYRRSCWRGAWTSLLIQSPFGELPTGHRSAQHIWNEAELAAVYEIYAAAHARAGKLAEAGAFKRGARLALRSVREWIRPDGGFHIVKNRFPVGARHGYETYSVHANYSLLAGSMLCVAWQQADDAIPERPTPADVGGFVVSLPDFGTVVANVGGNYVEYRTRPSPHYNPAGLVRVHLRGGHPQLGWSDGLPGDPAAATGDLAVVEESAGRVRFRVGADEIAIDAGGVTVTRESTSRIVFPLLLTDGRDETVVTLSGGMIDLVLGDRGIRVEILEPAGVTWVRTGDRLKHHNGLVEPVHADIPGARAVFRLRALQPDPNPETPRRLP